MMKKHPDNSKADDPGNNYEGYIPEYPFRCPGDKEHECQAKIEHPFHFYCQREIRDKTQRYYCRQEYGGKKNQYLTHTSLPILN
jgi:hypothetical protein